MNFIAIRLIVLACVFGAALIGMFLRAVLPEQHLSADSKDTVRLGIGVISTMAALVGSTPLNRGMFFRIAFSQRQSAISCSSTDRVNAASPAR